MDAGAVGDNSLTMPPPCEKAMLRRGAGPVSPRPMSGSKLAAPNVRVQALEAAFLRRHTTQ
jgi:hypothetical protein